MHYVSDVGRSGGYPRDASATKHKGGRGTKGIDEKERMQIENAHEHEMEQ